MITVKATREGLVGKKTATGFIIDLTTPFVALPSTQALRLWVKIHNPKTGRWCRALVLDVGPWNVDDHAYVFQPATIPLSLTANGIGYELRTYVDPSKERRPQVELSPNDKSGRIDNDAGIDLSEAVWKTLGMVDNGWVGWEFI